MNAEPIGEPTCPRAQMKRRLPATLNAVEALCRDLRDSVFAAIPAGECFVVELLLREALTNAVVHGVNQDAARTIECEVETMAGGIILRVRDDGEGFDWRARLNQMPQALAESGRGLEILRRYCARLQFNDAGNGVEMVRTFDNARKEESVEGDNHAEL